MPKLKLDLMKLSSTKTVRFTALVEASGAPEIATLWSRPEADKNFMKAVHQNRVLTVKQENVGAAKDFGIVGFQREKNASYLIFPKPLSRFKDRRVVGIKYELAKTSEPIGKVVKQRGSGHPGGGRGLLPAEAPPPTAPRSARLSHVRAPKRKTFVVSLRFVSTVDTTIEVEGASARVAREKALAKAATPDFTRGAITRKMRRVRQKAD